MIKPFLQVYNSDSYGPSSQWVCIVSWPYLAIYRRAKDVPQTRALHTDTTASHPWLGASSCQHGIFQIIRILFLHIGWTDPVRLFSRSLTMAPKSAQEQEPKQGKVIPQIVSNCEAYLQYSSFFLYSDELEEIYVYNNSITVTVEL